MKKHARAKKTKQLAGKAWATQSNQGTGVKPQNRAAALSRMPEGYAEGKPGQ